MTTPTKLLSWADRILSTTPSDPLVKSSKGPYIGPKGGKWADPAHTIPWREYVMTKHHSEEHAGAAVTPRVHEATGKIHLHHAGRLTTVEAYDPRALHVTEHGIIERATGALLAVANDSPSGGKAFDVDPKKLASKLSPAQRGALAYVDQNGMIAVSKRGSSIGVVDSTGDLHEQGRVTSQTLRKLVEQGLLAEDVSLRRGGVEPTPAGAFGSTIRAGYKSIMVGETVYKLTQLGQVVAAHAKGKP